RIYPLFQPLGTPEKPIRAGQRASVARARSPAASPPSGGHGICTGRARDDQERYEESVEGWLGERPCAARPSDHSLHSLTLICHARPAQFVEYYGVDGTADNEQLTFITGAHRLWEVQIKGRNLKRLADYLKEHRLAWVREAERDVYRDGQLYVERITVRPL